MIRQGIGRRIDRGLVWGLCKGLHGRLDGDWKVIGRDYKLKSMLQRLLRGYDCVVFLTGNVRTHIVQYVSNAILMPRSLLVYIKGSSFSCCERFKD